MLPADLILFPVTLHDNSIFLVLSSIQLDRQDRDIHFGPSLSFIDHEVKSSCIKQIIIRTVILKYMSNADFFLHDTLLIGIQHIIQCMVQILQKGLFCFCAVWLDPKRS